MKRKVSGPSNRALRDQKEFSRLQALAATLSKTDRILTGNGLVTVEFADPGIPAPSATDGERIKINPASVSLGSASGLVNIQGLNYHEVCHILFSPRKTDATLGEIRYRGLHKAWNVLEDMRIETLFAALYGNAAKFFTAPIITYFLNKEETWGLAHLFTYGRRFLPKELRDEFRSQFAGTEDQRERGERLINAYRKVSFPNARRIDLRTVDLVRAFADLLAELQAETGEDLADNHPECSAAERNKGATNEQTERAASQRRDDKDAAQDEEEGTSNAEDENDAGDDAAGAEEGSGDDGDESGDAGSGEGQSDDGDPGQDDSSAGENGSGSGDGAGDDDNPTGDAERGDGSASGGDESSDNGSGGGLNQETEREAPTGPLPGGKGNGHGMTREDLRDALSEALDDVMSDEDVKREIVNLTASMDDLRGVETDAEGTPYSLQPITPQMAAVSASLGDELRRLNEQFESGWHYGADHGRLNVSRVMGQDDYDPDEIYDAWEEGHEQDSGLCVVVALDLSYSMWMTSVDESGNRESVITTSCKALWTLLRGLQDAEVETVALGFENPCVRLFGREERVEPSQFRYYHQHCDYTDSSDVALEAARMFDASDKPNKLFIVITDGGMSRNVSEAAHTIASMDAVRMLVHIGDEGYQRQEFLDTFHVSRRTKSPTDLVPLVREAVTTLLEEAQRR